MGRQQFVKAVSALDSRTDRNIREYFVPTRTLGNAIAADSPAFALIGLKGAGKTTLFRALVENWQGEDGVTTVGLSTTSAEFDTYFEKVNCLQFEESVKRGILLFILRQIENNISKFPKDPHLGDWLIRKEKVLKASSQAVGLLKRFQGLSVLGCGLTLRPGEKIQSFDPLPAKETSGITELLREFGKSGRRLRIVIDDPDRLFSRGSTFDPHLLAGYILGTNQVASELDFVQFIHILKSSVYDTLRDVEEVANLPYDYFGYIGWSREELGDLVASRLKFSGADEVEIFSPSAAGSVDRIAELIRNGPRDLLRYLEIILKSSPDAVITNSNIDRQADAFKDEARRQMETVYAGIYDGVERFLGMMFQDRTELPIREFETRYQKLRLASDPGGVDFRSTWLRSGPKALRALIDTGAIDVQLHGKWIKPFEPEYFRVDIKDSSVALRPNAVFA